VTVEFPSTRSRKVADPTVGEIIEEVDVHLNEDKITYKATGQIKWAGNSDATAFQVVGEFKTVEEAFAAGFAEADRKIDTMKSGKL
jgi:hypothetical protein